MAIQERNAQHFEHEIRALYPKLNNCAFPMPVIGKSNMKKTHNNSTWYQIHVHFLKELRRRMRDDNYDAEQWNKDVARESPRLERWLEGLQ